VHIRVTDPSVAMHRVVNFHLFVLCLVTVWVQLESIWPPENCVQLKAIHSMRRGAGRGKPGGPIRLPLALGFKCVNCRNEFESRHAIDVHRRHPLLVGTPCADPKNHKSMSMTDRVDQAVGILRHHDTLGVLCCPPLMFVLLITCSHANTTSGYFFDELE
jgi:hypothetical protein